MPHETLLLDFLSCRTNNFFPETVVRRRIGMRSC